MKKATWILLALVFVFVFVGCQEKLTQEERKSQDFFSYIGYSGEGSEANDGHIIKGDELGDLFNHIVDFDGYGRFITDDGDLYKLSFGKLFSNDLHYMKIETDIKFEKFLGNYLIGKDNQLYGYDGGTFISYDFNTCSWSNLTTKFYDWSTTLKDKDLSKILVVYSEEYEGGPIKANKYYEVSENSIYSCEDNSCIYTFDDETIEFVTDNTIKTNKRFYRMGELCVNQEECDKYVDVNPIYEITPLPCDLPFDFDFVKFGFEGPGYIVANNYLYRSYTFGHTVVNIG